MSKSKLFGKCGRWYTAIGRLLVASLDVLPYLVWCEIVVDTRLNRTGGEAESFRRRVLQVFLQCSLVCLLLFRWRVSVSVNSRSLKAT